MNRAWVCVPALMLVLACLPLTARSAVEMETDPLAFALQGYSYHVAIAFQSSRVDVGSFGLRMPEDTQNMFYTVDFAGQGVKWDYFGQRVDGLFWGIEAAQSTLDFEFDDPGDAFPAEFTQRQLAQSGVRVGYRFGREGFYVTPWIGIGQGQLSAPVTLGGVPYKFQRLYVFPTVHLGYRF